MLKRFKWQIAQELRAAGKSQREIAVALGIQHRDVSTLLSYAKKRKSVKGPTQVVRLARFADGELKRRLTIEAQSRNMTMTGLADLLLANVIESDLFTAVLDD